MHSMEPVLFFQSDLKTAPVKGNKPMDELIDLFEKEDKD